MRLPPRRLLIVGAGGHGRSVAEAVLASGTFEIAGFVDDAAPASALVSGYPVLGTTDEVSAYRAHAQAAIVAIGNNALREALCHRLVAVQALGWAVAWSLTAAPWWTTMRRCMTTATWA